MGNCTSLCLDHGTFAKLLPTLEMFQFLFTVTLRPPNPPRDIKSLIPKQPPTWGTEPGNGSRAKATWLGYVVICHDITYRWSPPGHRFLLRLRAESCVFTVMLAISLSSPRLLAQHVVSVSYSIPYFHIAVHLSSGWDPHVSLVRAPYNLMCCFFQLYSHITPPDTPCKVEEIPAVDAIVLSVGSFPSRTILFSPLRILP
jgi:hypothetical protein